MDNLSERIKSELLEKADPKYREFHSGLVPGTENIMGVRIPELRKIARSAAKEDWRNYLEKCCPDTYEEVMIRGMIIGYAKMDDEERMQYLNRFVPEIDNWAVCDSCMSTYKFMQKKPEIWYSYLRQKVEEGTEFSIRFGVVGLMDYFINEEYIDRLLKIFDKIQHEGYYVKMAVAWAISMCYVKFPEKTRAFLEHNHLDTFTQNKAIQKIRESYRVSQEEKEELKKLKVPSRKEDKNEV